MNLIRSLTTIVAAGIIFSGAVQSKPEFDFICALVKQNFDEAQKALNDGANVDDRDPVIGQIPLIQIGRAHV